MTWSSAADGANFAACARRFADAFGPRRGDRHGQVSSGFGTTYPFGRADVRGTSRARHGVFAVHGYPIGNGRLDVHRRDRRALLARGRPRRLRRRPAAPAPSDQVTQSYLEKLFATPDRRLPPAGEQLPAWGNFPHLAHPTVAANRAGPDRGRLCSATAAHTAHFSVGSGTKMAMEDGHPRWLAGAGRGAKGPYGPLTASTRRLGPSYEAEPARAGRPPFQDGRPAFAVVVGTLRPVLPEPARPGSFAFHFLQPLAGPSPSCAQRERGLRRFGAPGLVRRPRWRASTRLRTPIDVADATAAPAAS